MKEKSDESGEVSLSQRTGDHSIGGKGHCGVGVRSDADLPAGALASLCKPFRNTPDAVYGANQPGWGRSPGHHRPDGRLRVRRLQATRHECAAVDAAGDLRAQGPGLYCVLSAAQASADTVPKLWYRSRIGLSLLPQMRPRLDPDV